MNPTAPLTLTERPVLRLYQQVEHYLRTQIEEGHFRSGDRLPSVRELCDHFGGINHLTVRQAIKRLSEEKLVTSIQGRGTFVTPQQPQHRRIALLLSDLEDVACTRIAKIVQEEFARLGFSALILDSRGHEDVQAEYLSTLDALPVDGAIISPVQESALGEQIYALKTRGFPFVLINRRVEDIRTACVTFDSVGAGAQVAQYLMGQGKKRIAWVGDLQGVVGRERLRGFRNTLNDCGISHPGFLAQHVPLTQLPVTSGSPGRCGELLCAVERLLAMPGRIEAIVCDNTEAAGQILQHLQSLCPSLPGRCPVVAFGEASPCHAGVPSLCTVRPSWPDMGRAAAEILLENMQGGQSLEQRMLPVTLVPGSTRQDSSVHLN